MSRPITSRKIELISQNFPTKKRPWPDGFIGEFSKYLKN